MVVDRWSLAQPIDICRWIAYNQSVAVKELAVVRQRGVCCGLPDVDEQWAERTAALMKALADPTRLTMVASLYKADGRSASVTSRPVSTSASRRSLTT